MMHSNWSRAKQVFQEALEKTGTERTHFVAAACGDDAELRVQVEALLAAHDQAGEFLASPTGAGADAAAKAVAEQASDHPPEGPGTQIGPYKLLELIGEGGFGTVYMADQVGPIRRRVALKIIKPGMDTKEVIARFESERQALAMMDHPNIARVLDAGAAESGRPYFVMELVKGVPITEYCDANRLSTRERLDLFVDVCKAVHHAHEKGVIHRDIKPSNVMVTLHDGTPVPKVIDFGIAKATNHPLTEKTLFTAYGQFLGTPIYMSPEQAALGGLEIDRRCDVYALGVLLYELLTGTTPFEPAALRSRAFMQLMRIIREEDPPTPSARLNTLGERLTEIAASRHVEPSALAKLVRGDLDWIVMRAIEKDRRRRYDSAVDLAADLSRYFRHEPVIARKPSAAYRLSKFAKRRRGLILATGGIAGAVLLGVALAQSVRKSNAEPAPPTNHLFIDWLRDSGMTPPTRDGRHRLRYSLARHGYEVVNIATGKVQRLIAAGPKFDVPRTGYNDVSPDGRVLAIPRFVAGSPERGDSGLMELRLFTSGGSEDGRLVGSLARGEHAVVVIGWAPARTHLWLSIFSTDQTTFSVASVDLKDGSVRVLKTLAWRNGSPKPSLSPDARFIAYDGSIPGEPSDIFIASTDGRDELRIANPARDRWPTFTPDGSGIVFLSDRSGNGLWYLPLQDGRPSGEARAVWDDIGPSIQQMQFADNGSLFYDYSGNDWALFAVDIDFTRGIIGQPQRIPARRGEIDNAPAYSPDGRFLAHTRGSGRRVVLRELATGNEREYQLAGSLIAPAIDFCPDGRSLLVSGYEGTNGAVVFRVDAERGGLERIPVAAEPVTSAVCIGSGGELLFAAARKVNEPARIVRRLLVTGKEDTVFRGPAAALFFARSPDGRRIAIIPQSQPGSVLAKGDVPLFLLSLRTWDVTNVRGDWSGARAWLPGSDGLLLAKKSLADSANSVSPELTLWRAPLDGRARLEIARMRLPAYQNARFGAHSFSINPAGTQMAFERHAGAVWQMWAIDNLLPFIRSGASVTVKELPRF